MLGEAKLIGDTVGNGSSRKWSGKLAAVESSNQYKKLRSLSIRSWKTA